MPPSLPNQELAWWFARSGWTGQELVDLVQERLDEFGAPHLTLDTQRVNGWLSGEQPRHPIPTVLAQLFSDRCGRLITEQDLGLTYGQPVAPVLTGPDADFAQPGQRPYVGIALKQFMNLDIRLNERGTEGARTALSTGAALIEPIRRWLATRFDCEGPPVGPRGDLDEEEVTDLETATRAFRECERRQPSGLSRKAVIGQLYEITELLRYSYPDDIARRLFATVAQLAEMVGSMSRDEGLEATAQKYFMLALYAAKQASDDAHCGEIMSRMAGQALQLGHPQDALALIACARTGSGESASASVRSLFLLIEAWSYAHLGWADDCHRAVGQAQEAFADSRPEEEPPWLSFDAADLIGMAGHAYRLLSEHDPIHTVHAEPLICQALALRPAEKVRDRALALIDLAMTRLLRNDLEAACQSGEEALALVDQLRLSAYVLDQVRLLRTRTERYGDAPQLRSLTDRLTGLLDPLPPDPDAVTGGRTSDYRGETTTANIPGPV